MNLKREGFIEATRICWQSLKKPRAKISLKGWHEMGGAGGIGEPKYVYAGSKCSRQKLCMHFSSSATDTLLELGVCQSVLTAVCLSVLGKKNLKTRSSSGRDTKIFLVLVVVRAELFMNTAALYLKKQCARNTKYLVSDKK
jgi:hypothetical protein